MIVDISFQAELPPPYAFAAVIKCKIGNEVFLDFQQEYLGRGNLNESEILAEGFSLNDDLKWQGIIGKNWKSVLSDFNSCNYTSEPNRDNYIHITIDGSEKGFPDDTNQAALTVQELIQAVFENSERALPLHIEIGYEGKIVPLEWAFAERLFKMGNDSRDWNWGRILLSQIYSVDYDSIDSHKKPIGTLAVHFGDNHWFNIENKAIAEAISVIND